LFTLWSGRALFARRALLTLRSGGAGWTLLALLALRSRRALFAGGAFRARKRLTHSRVSDRVGSRLGGGVSHCLVLIEKLCSEQPPEQQVSSVVLQTQEPSATARNDRQKRTRYRRTQRSDDCHS
jgi:hypothetical protein